MKRIFWSVIGTIAVLGGLFLYRTSLGQGVVASPAEPARIVGEATTGGSTAADTAASSAAADTAASSAAADTAASSAAADTAASSAAASGGASLGGTSSASGASAGTSASRTVRVLGAVEQTAYGPVQVELTITGSVITDVTAVQYPTAERRSQQINSYALPQLRSELLASQSAKIDGVSGATYTTEGYQASVQSALDAAHRAA